MCDMISGKSQNLTVSAHELIFEQFTNDHPEAEHGPVYWAVVGLICHDSFRSLPISLP